MGTITKNRISLSGFPGFPDLGLHLPPTMMLRLRLLLHVYVEVGLLQTSQLFVGEQIPVSPQGTVRGVGGTLSQLVVPSWCSCSPETLSIRVVDEVSWNGESSISQLR